MQASLKFIAIMAAMAWLPGVQAEPVNRVVSLTTSGQPPTSYSGDSKSPAIAQHGRLVVFASEASNLVPDDTNGRSDVFLRDLLTQTTTRLSVGPGSVQGDGKSSDPVVTPDGRYVAFLSDATNLIAGGADAHTHVYLLDRHSGQISLQDRHSNGTAANYNAIGPLAISANGRYIAFASYSGNLVDDDSNGAADVFVRDVQGGSTTRVSLSSSGGQANAASSKPAISDDGRFVAFESYASNLVDDDNDKVDVFLHDRQTHATILVSRNPQGPQNHDSYAPQISADGRHVAFLTWYPFDPVADTDTDKADVYVYDRVTSGYTLASPGALDEDVMSTYGGFAMSRDSRYIAYVGRVEVSQGGGYSDLYRYDRALDTTVRVSLPLDGSGTPSRGESASVAMDGNAIAYVSNASNLVEGATGAGGFLVYHWGPENIDDLDHIFIGNFEAWPPLP